MTGNEGWTGLFSSAFTQSRNAMALVDEDRHFVDVNAAFLRLLGHSRETVIGRPVWDLFVEDRGASADWAGMLASGEFTGQRELICADGSTVAVQWGASVETVDDRRLVLFVALSTSRWGSRFRRSMQSDHEGEPLSTREHEVVRLVALGASGPEIADELVISHNTVRTHVRNAMSKTGARSRAHLVARVIGDGTVIE